MVHEFAHCIISSCVGSGWEALSAGTSQIMSHFHSSGFSWNLLGPPRSVIHLLETEAQKTTATGTAGPWLLSGLTSPIRNCLVKDSAFRKVAVSLRASGGLRRRLTVRLAWASLILSRRLPQRRATPGLWTLALNPGEICGWISDTHSATPA
jgi:hypothetical protein